MKRIFGILIAFSTIFMIACTEDNELAGTDSIYLDDIDFAATSEAALDDVDDMTEESLSLSAYDAGRHSGPKRRNLPDCAVVTKDEEAQTIVIDFGNECIGHKGRVKSGKILLSWVGEKGIAGFTKTVTFEDYIVDGVLIEGTRTSLNVTGNEANPKTRTSTLVGGKMTFEDGSTATREASHTLTVTETDDDKIKARFGTSSGINMDGLAYAKVIEEANPVTFKQSCKEDRIFSPVSGIVTISIEGEADKIVDYGDGTCDNLATVTQGDLVEEIEVNAKKRRRGFQIRG
jgi:hypothetical protein